MSGRGNSGSRNKPTDITIQYPYDKTLMKVSKKQYDKLIADWKSDLQDSENSEESIVYNNEFYLRQIYKKKYSPLI